MLNINTRITDSSDMRLAKSAKILAEGQALVFVPGEGGLAPSKGESGEIFAGFVMRRTSAAPIVEDYMTKVEKFVIAAPEEGDSSVELQFEPLSSSVCVIDCSTGTAIAAPIVEGKVISSANFKNDMEIEVVYKYALTVVQARSIFGDQQPGGAAGDLLGQVGCAKRGQIYTSWFDTTVNWHTAKQIKLAANGMITNENGSGEVLPGAYVVGVPNVDEPFLGIEFSAA